MKNIVLIITDTFRYDNLKNKKERKVLTPELNKFAENRATSIENFYAGSFPTIPHRTDIATGTLGWMHYSWQPIDKSSSNHIASLLKEKGYNTQLICDCPHLFNSNFQHDFDAAYQHRGQEGDKPLLHLNDKIKEVMPSEKTRQYPKYKEHPLVDQHRWTNRYFKCEEETFMAKTSSSAVRWLEENYQAEPFFLWTDFFDPHEPWDPPEYLVRKYEEQYEGIPMIHPNYGPADDYTDKELRNLWAHYAAESELVDRYIGRIIQKITDLRLWDDTIVIVTSDHGHSLGEHNRVGKSNISENDERYWPIYPEVGQVPFLIAGGNVPEGNSLDLIAQPVDIFPTLEDLADISLSPDEDFEGKSFAEQITDKKEDHREFAVSGSYVGKELDDNAVTPFLVKNNWGYTPVGAQGEEELYNLNEDPLAEKNIAKKDKDLCNKLKDNFLFYLNDKGASQEFIENWR